MDWRLSLLTSMTHVRADTIEIYGLLESLDASRMELRFAMECIRSAEYVRQVTMDVRTTDQLQICLQSIETLPVTTECLELTLHTGSKEQACRFHGRDIGLILSNSTRVFERLNRLDDVRIIFNGVHNAEHVFVGSFSVSGTEQLTMNQMSSCSNRHHCQREFALR